MVALDWILIIILITMGSYEVWLLVTHERTLTQKYQDLDTPRWLNLTVTIGFAVFAYFLLVQWNVQIHPFVVALCYLIFGHVFGRF